MESAKNEAGDVVLSKVRQCDYINLQPIKCFSENMISR